MSDSNTNKNQSGENQAKKPAAKKPAKPKKPSLTPRQTQIRAETLVRGIDNSTAKIEKELANIKASRKELPSLITGLSNAAITAVAAPKSQPKAAAKAKATPAAKAKAASAKKAATKKAATKKASPKPAANRPTFKDAAVQILQAKGPLSKADLRRAYIAQYGSISSQSVYGVLNKNTDIFKVDGNTVSLAAKASKEDLESFVRQVEKDQSTAATA